MTAYRLHRLFHPASRRALDVAIDHGIFGEPSVLTGIEDIGAAVNTIVGAAPDAIQLTPGQARHLQQIPDRGKPALVLRADVANVYGHPLDPLLFSSHFPNAVEIAVRADAVCIVANLMDLPGHPEIRADNIRTIQALKAEAERYGMPLMVEPLVMRDNPHGSYLVEGDTTRIVALVRQAVELGADLIKADPTDRVEDYHLVVQAASGLPILVRGGGRVDDRELLTRTRALLDQGADGVVYGRNIVQHRDPAGITRALMGMLHEDLSVEDALDRLTAAA